MYSVTRSISVSGSHLSPEVRIKELCPPCRRSSWGRRGSLGRRSWAAGPFPELKGAQAGLGVERGAQLLWRREGREESEVWGLWPPVASSPAPLLSLVWAKQRARYGGAIMLAGPLFCGGQWVLGFSHRWGHQLLLGLVVFWSARLRGENGPNSIKPKHRHFWCWGIWLWMERTCLWVHFFSKEQRDATSEYCLALGNCQDCMGWNKDSGLWTRVDLSFLFSWTPKSLRMVIAALKLQDACSLKEKLWQT